MSAAPIYHRLATIQYKDTKQRFKLFSTSQSEDIVKTIQARFNLSDGTSFYLTDSDGDTVTTAATLPTGTYNLHVADCREEKISTEITVKGHMISQPTRAVVWLLKLHGVTFKFDTIDIFAGEQKSEKLLALNPNGVVPVIVESDGFALYESNAILAYVATKYGWNDWYPKDLRLRARIDQYSHWHHHAVRIATTEILVPKIGEKFGRLKPEEAKAKYDPGSEKFRKSLQVLNDTYLKESKYIGGSKPSIADLNAYCEIGQLKILNWFDFDNFKHVQRWLKAMEQVSLHDDVHQALFGFAEKLK